MASPNAALTLGLLLALGASSRASAQLAPLRVEIDDTTFVEGNSGTAPAGLSVVGHNPGPNPVVISYATVDGLAVAGRDYVATSGQLTLPVGDSQQAILVSVVGDTVYDARESFFVDLTAPPEVQVVRGRGTVTILEDDAVPAIVVTPYLRIDEGDSGTTSGSISVALAGEWEHAIEVRFSVFTSELPDVTVTPSGGKLMLEPQGSPQSVTFSVLGNTRPQADKSFPVYFFSGEDESVSARTVVDIIDNEPRGVYVYDVGPVREPGPGSARIVYFRVFWAGKIGQAYPVVRYATRDGTALAGSDYLSVSGDVTDWRACSSGTCEAFVPVMVQGDSLREPHESFFLDVTSDPGVAVVRGSATATVADTRGTVDFTGEGKADIVWRHTGGALFIWAMDGTSVAGASYLDPISLDWQIQGTGDFNGDGRTDSGESATPAPTSCGPWTARKSRAGQVMRTPPLAESRA